MESNYRFTLDLQKHQSQTSLPALLGDTDRTLHITFSDEGSPFYIETGCLAMLTIKRPTGTYIQEFCEIRNNSTVIYPFIQNKNTCAVSGIHECDVTLFNFEGEQIASPRFSLIVSENAANSDDINLSDENKNLISAMISAEASRQESEIGRVNAEALRIEAEIERENAEQGRKATIEELKKLGIVPIYSRVTLLASAWVGEDSPYSQVVNIDHVSQYSKVDLQPSVEQLAIFHDKDLAFVTENEDGVVIVYAVGDKPTNDYTIQVIITEVLV